MSLPVERSLPRLLVATGPVPASEVARLGHGAPSASPTSAGQEVREGSDYDTDRLVRMLQPAQAVRARRGWRAWLRLGPSQRELQERARLEAVRAQFDRPVTVMVANPKGGTGKTPISLLLAGEFGDARGGGVVVVDNNENRGTAAFRSHFPHRRTVADLLEDADALERPEAQFTDLAFYLAHQIAGKYYVLASDESVTRQLDEERFIRLHRILSRFFAVIVIDSGNNELASNWLAGLEVADALVVPTQWRQDHLVTANKMLEKLRSRRHPILERTLIVGTNAPAAAQAGPRKAALDWFSSEHRLPVVEIPTDAHIHEGGVLNRSKMGAGTRAAGLAAAAVAARLMVDAAARPMSRSRRSTQSPKQ
ncbi:MAG TPA: chromosome partitioning protein, partial [Propionibacteriaceae bacterium]